MTAGSWARPHLSSAGYAFSTSTAIRAAFAAQEGAAQRDADLRRADRDAELQSGTQHISQQMEWQGQLP
jgi:hypothetical protein